MDISRKFILGVAVVLVGAVVLVLWGDVHTRIAVQPNLRTHQQVIQVSPHTGQPLIQTSSQPGQPISSPVVLQDVRQKQHHVIQSREGEVPVAVVNRQPLRRKPVEQPQQTKIERAPVIRLIQTGNVLTKPVNLLTKPVNSSLVKTNLQQSAPLKTRKAGERKAVDGFGLDIGNGLPLPALNTTLIAPQDRPAGFHVGVNYHLDQNWELTGQAGVTTNEGPMTNSVMKPSLNQLGIQAGYRF
jgi:hypothetical protein